MCSSCTRDDAVLILLQKLLVLDTLGLDASGQQCPVLLAVHG